MSQDDRMEPANRKYADPLGGTSPQMATGSAITLIGYWEGRSAPGWPSVTGFVDEHWDLTERDLVASYLEQGYIPWVQAGISPCRMCGRPNGSAERTDGAYLWPDGLAHYIREHGVRPPVSVIRHIVSAGATPHPGDTGRMRPGQVDRDWWRTATLDS
jgi:hypothetical protein